MNSENTKVKEDVDNLNRKIMITQLLDAPAMIALGFGLFGKFAVDPGSLHPILANESFVNMIFFIAVPWAVFCMYKFTALTKERHALLSKQNR